MGGNKKPRALRQKVDTELEKIKLSDSDLLWHSDLLWP